MNGVCKNNDDWLFGAQRIKAQKGFLQMKLSMPSICRLHQKKIRINLKLTFEVFEGIVNKYNRHIQGDIKKV